MDGSRNWYTVFYDQSIPPIGQWIVIYAYGRNPEDAFAEGFYPSDIQPSRGDVENGKLPSSAARALAAALDEESRLGEANTYLDYLLSIYPNYTPREGE